MSTRQKELLIREFGTWCYNERGYSPVTIKNYTIWARATDTWLQENRGHVLVAASPKDLRAFLFSRTANARTRNNIRQALKAFGDYLVSENIWNFNAAADLPRLPQSRPLPKALDEGPAAGIWKAAKALGSMMASLTGLYLFAGGRLTETRLLEWPDIDLNSGVVRFKGKGPGGRSKERDVPLHPDVLAALKTWRAKTNDPHWVFPSPKLPNRPASASHIQRLIRKVGELANVHLYPHLLRHTVATAMLDAGANIRNVQEFLGHANISTTAIYLKVLPSRLRDDVNRLDFSGNGQPGERRKSDA